MLHVMNHRVLISVCAVIAAVALGVFYYWVTGTPRNPDAENFTSGYNLVLTDYDGNEVQLSDYRRHVLVVYAWASWCPYCGDELESLAQLKSTYGDDVVVLAVNRGEPLGDARAFTDKLALHEDVVLLLDPLDALYKDIEGYAMPETLFIDARGEIRFHQRGPIQNETLHAQLKALIGE